MIIKRRHLYVGVPSPYTKQWLKFEEDLGGTTVCTVAARSRPDSIPGTNLENELN